MERIEQNLNTNNFEYKKGEEKMLEKRYQRLMSLFYSNSGQVYVPSSNPWNLSKEHTLGTEEVYNSPLSAKQFIFALAMSRHEEVDKFIDQKTDGETNPIAILDDLYEHQVLSGLKVLDLGCGVIPVFARMLRAMGADVYTADLVSAEEFKIREKNKSSQFVKIEQEKHIQTNLTDTDVIAVITSKSGGDFSKAVCFMKPRTIKSI